MAVRDILLLGDPRLLEKSEPVIRDEVAEARAVGRDLRDTMAAFRAEHGWGRAIAAPQIGVAMQVVSVDLQDGSEPLLLLNPVLSDHSEEMLRLWDDCMSFPDLLVEVRRHASCRLTYRDLEWRERSLRLEGAVSELIQHEVDHLHGVLATMRAVDASRIALRSQRDLLGESAFANP